ncbi:MAG: CCA tRNA nucleotidyltransferase [Dethiobacter sp.]|jgi:tRNA nucleotidyltransferase (CCA-adding enzyme)|nr:MAG: CCA tRNA nucleotidyltransferase [Dethiobacter sp.]
MNNLTPLINTALSKELHALIYHLGYCSQQGSFKTYAVGGFVRDLLLGRENRDLDLVVEGSAVDFAKSLLKILPGRLRCYERFGTATLVLSKGIVFDMVTARKEFYAAPGALPSVEQSTLKNDLFRRDFTINTMACALNTETFGRLYDFFGGRKDLEKGIIRVLYKLSFVDDPLRIIRAIRFEQRFDFVIEEDSLAMLTRAINNRLWEKVSKERLYNEVRLIFREPEPSKVLTRLDELNLFHEIFPRLVFNQQIKSRLQRLERVLTEISLNKLPKNWNYLVLYLSALFYELTEHDFKFLCHLMRLKREERLNMLSIREKIPFILLQLKTSDLSSSRLYHFLEGLPEEGLLLIMALAPEPHVQKHVLFYWDYLVKKTPSITGKDLLEAGIKPGPVFNRILKKLHEAVLDEKISGKEEELGFLHFLINNEIYAEE